MRKLSLLVFALTIGTAGCGGKKPKRDMIDPPKAPIADLVPVARTIHDVELVDPYSWLRDRENPDVLSYLEAENSYTKAMTPHYNEAVDLLFTEMRSRIKETDESAPYPDGEYFYYQRTVEGLNYPIHCRKKGSLEAKEEVLLDENKLAEGHDYFEVGVLAASPDHSILAYSVDTKGNERYTLRFKDLATGKDLAEVIEETSYSLAWANDNKTVYYDRVDAANRPFKAFRHTLGTDPAKDDVVFHEPDDRFFLGISKTRSERYILLEIGSQVTTEVHTLDANDPTATPILFAERKQNEEYYVYHHEDAFFVLTNSEAENFKLMRAGIAATRRDSWTEVVPHRDDVMLVDLDVFKKHVVIHERSNAVPQVQVWNVEDDTKYTIEMPEPVFSARSGTNANYDTEIFRFQYTSLVTPASTFDFNLETKERILIKQREVFGYDPAQYTSERIIATANDGTKIPISIVYKKDARTDTTMPLLLSGYGSYGSTYDPSFRTNRVSLLDRGVAFAWAHVRGGADLGRAWYKAGKYLNKKNTFNDFIACAEHLIESNYTTSGRLAISGGSAGGLLMGAVVNARPDLFKAVVAAVPFVDVLNTMLDETLPLTVIEWEEWGNPKEKQFFDYIASYSPYDNVTAQNYPNMLITAGLNDPRVGYWEPAKWTAKLRATKTDQNVLLLKTNMGAGHGGASGRYDYLKEVAFEYAFILDHLGRLNKK